MFNLLVYFEIFFCVWYMIVVQFHSFVYGYPVFSKSVIEETFFPTVYSWPYICGFMSGLLLHSIGQCVYFCVSVILFLLL